MLHITVCGYITIIIVNPYCPQWGMGPHQYLFFHRVLSFAIVCASPQDKPITLSSVSTVFLQVVLGLTLLLFSCRCPTKGILSGDIHKTGPSDLSRRFLIWRSILTQPVSWYRLLLEILLGQKMLQIGHYNEHQNCSHQEIMLSLSKSRNNVIIK